jgi:outer membrane receptor protein involved in Fe transport
LPLITTICSAIFCYQLFSRYRKKGGGLHLLWWGIGMATYGLGTLTESLTTLFGWDPFVFRSWYVTGAFLGGYPLAQGSIYLLMKRRFAHASAWIVSSFIALGAVFVFLTPLDLSLVETHRLSGEVIEWRWIRMMTPFVNLYAVIFLVGGAIVSAIRFRKAPQLRHRYVGNILIAIGAILPGIGGTATRAGYVEALYITELAGLLLIYAGYRLNISKKNILAETAAEGARAPQGKDNEMLGKVASLLLAGSLTFMGATLPVAAAEPVDEAAASASDETTSTDDSDGADSELSFFATTTVTATGSEADPFELSTPVSVVTAEEIERREPNSSADLLRELPGVDVNGVGPNQARPVIRGLRGLRVLFLENGLRMNNPRRQTDFGEISGLVDMDSVEAVEVVRGPASVLYGTDAIGGVLNLVTRTAGPAAGLSGSFGVRYSDAGDQVRGQASVEKRGERFAFNLGASISEASDYESASGSFGDIHLDEGARVIDSGVEESSIFGRFDYTLSDQHNMFFRFNRYRADDAGFGFVDPELVGDESGATIRILYPFQDFDRYTLGYEGFQLDNPVADSVSVQLYHQSNERELVNDINIAFALFPGAPDSEVQADTNNFTDLDTLGLRAEMVKIISDNNLLTWGVEGYEDDSFNTDSSVTTTTLRFPFPPFEVVEMSSDDIANAPNATNSSLSAFIQDEMLIGDRFRMSLGARYQSVETNAESTPGWDVSQLDFDDDQFVGAINLVYDLTNNLNLIGSYATAFRAPNIIERLFNGPTPEGVGFQILNPDLVSETSENYDLGIKYRRANAIFEAILFRNDISDGIVQYFLSDEEIAQLPPDLQDEILESGVDFVVQQRNTNSLTYEGLELIIGYRSNNGITVGGNYTHLNAESEDSLNPPTGDTYEDKYVAYLRWEQPKGRYWTEYRVRHNGSGELNLQENEDVPPVGDQLPSFTVHTIGAGVNIGSGGVDHRVGLFVENLTDELYSEFSNAAFFRPQPGRTLLLTYRLGV